MKQHFIAQSAQPQSDPSVRYFLSQLQTKISDQEKQITLALVSVSVDQILTLGERYDFVRMSTHGLPVLSPKLK